MSNGHSTLTKALGLALIVAGVGFAWWGFQISETLTVQLSAKISGALPNEVMYRYIGAAASGAAGLFLLVKG